MELARAGEYTESMAGQQIVLDVDERRDIIRGQAQALAASAGGRIPEDPGLLDEVTNLVERPTALLGRFDPEYLALPREVLVTVMKKHQRYFPVVDAQSDELLPYFITVRNGDEQSLDVVREGNEDVLRARFADAKFFYEHDTARPLESFLPRLNTLTFQERLGSMLDKSKRLAALVPVLGRALDVDEEEMAVTTRAAELSKACLLYTSDAADDLLCVDLGGRRIIKKKKTQLKLETTRSHVTTHTIIQPIT